MRIAARWIWTGTAPPFPGAVEIAAGRIAAVDRDPAAARGEPPTLLTVGLANSHVHLDLTFPRGGARLAGSFPEWLAGVVERRRREGRAGLERAAAAGVRSSLEAGTTLLLDDDPAGWSLGALAASPLRRVVFREVIALARDAFDPAPLETFLGERVDPARELRAIAPHSPYTVHPEVLPGLVARADRARVPWQMHVAECAWERSLLESGSGEGAEFIARFGADPAEFSGGGSAVARLEAAGLLSERALLVHGNHLDDAEIALLARSGAAVVYCPRSHAYFGHPPHPLPRLLAAGVPLLIGTDGAISAGDLSLLEELRAAHAAHPEVPPERLWRAATATPRQILAERFGSGTIAPGEPADLALWELTPGSRDPLRDLLEGPVERSEPLAVWIDGSLVAGNAPEGSGRPGIAS